MQPILCLVKWKYFIKRSGTVIRDVGGSMIYNKMKSFTAAALAAVFLLAGCQQNAEMSDPVITSIAIPHVGISSAGNKIPVTIVGKNFTAPGISAAYFNGTGAIFSNFKVVSDILATAEVSCPYTAREYPVTVHCKNASKTGTITVKDYSLWTPGKIVLADKTVVDKALYTAIDPANPPIAVVCRNLYGIPFGVALHKGNSLLWAKEGTTGINTKFEGISCTPSQTGSGAAASATFTGDTDGSDNWDYICSVDLEGTANAAWAYPAFDWVNKYNTTYSDKLGGTRPAWYMPSIAELCEVYKNKEVINASLLKINGLDGTYADSNLGTDSFWSSSQHSDYNLNAWRAGFGSGNLYRRPPQQEQQLRCVLYSRLLT